MHSRVATKGLQGCRLTHPAMMLGSFGHLCYRLEARKSPADIGRPGFTTGLITRLISFKSISFQSRFMSASSSHKGQITKVQRMSLSASIKR